MIIIWAPSTSPQVATYGSDLSAEDLQHEKEYWKPRTTFRCDFLTCEWAMKCKAHTKLDVQLCKSMTLPGALRENTLLQEARITQREFFQWPTVCSQGFH
jgi:hypothetical protein